MKKITLVAIAALIFVSCKKEVSVNNETLNGNENLTEVSIIDGRIIFPDEEFYDNYFQSAESGNALNAKLLISNFVSFTAENKEKALNPNQKSSKNKCEIPAELIENNKRFFNLLNKDGVLQVGDYVFRYNYCDDGAWVIKQSNFSNPEYKNKFMAGDLVDGVVGFFPSDVDGFEALEMGYISMPKEGTKDYMTLKQKDRFNEKIAAFDLFGPTIYEHFYIYDQINGSARFRGKLSYEKFVFYFNFYGKEKYQLNGAFGWITASSGDRNWRVDYDYRCRRKGKSYDYTGSGTIQRASEENKAEKTFYDGSRGLRNLSVSWKVYNVNSNKRDIYRGTSDGGGFMIHFVSENFYTYINTDNFNFIPIDPMYNPVFAMSY